LTNAPASANVLIASKLTSFGMISREDVAEVLVQALLQPEARHKTWRSLVKKALALPTAKSSSS